MRGRKPKPAELHEMNGNPSKLNLKAKRSRMPRAPEASAEAPAYLSRHARPIYQGLFATVTAMRVMTAADVAALAELSELLAEIQHYRKELAKMRLKNQGDLVEGSTGQLALHPYARQVVTSSRRALNYLVEFGLTPSARSRVEIETDNEADDLLTFVAGMN